MGGIVADSWVVTFVRTGTENKVINILKDKLCDKVFVPFLPTREEMLKKNGVWQEHTKVLFPGYIFIQAFIEPKLIFDELNGVFENLRNSCPLIRLLYYGNDKGNVAIPESERNFLEGLFDDNYCVKLSKGFKDDDEVYITDGPLVGREDAIKKVIRHQRKVYLDVEFGGELCEVKLALELSNKSKN